MLTTTVSYAQFWEALLGVGSAVLENHIDNSNRYSSQEKESMRNSLNTINNAINTNQNARNATKEAYDGNYTGAVIQGAQTIMNAAGNHSYDSYLNNANQINNANREYKQDLQNGMDSQEALDKRNTAIGYSVAESAIKLQDEVAQKRIEEARRQRELEKQFGDNSDYYSEPNYYESNTRTNTNSNNAPEASKQFSHDNDTGKESDNTNSANKYYNNKVQKLSSYNTVKFLTNSGQTVSLNVMNRGFAKGSCLYYNNHSGKAQLLTCNNVNIKLKYAGINAEQTITDACSFIIPANSEGELEWTAIFPNLHPYAVERIEVRFVDTNINESSNNAINTTNKNNAQILTKNQIIKYVTDKGVTIAIGIEQEDGCKLYYNNLYNDQKALFSCNSVSIKVKYVGDDQEQTLSDACSFIMPANSFNYLNLSDVFFNISEIKEIESIKILFVDAHIK